MKGRRVLIGAVAFTALFLLVGRWSAALYTDNLWYRSLGAGDVWRTRFFVSSILTVASFAIVSLFAFINLYAVRQSVVSLVLPTRIGNLEIGEEVPGLYLTYAAAVMSVAIGAALTLPTDLWHSALLANSGKPFGETDWYFRADLGFFVYWLPFETAVHFWSVVVLASVTVLVVALYALTPSLRWDRGSLYVSAYVRRHFTMLGAVLLLVLAWSYRLGMYRLLSEGSGTAGVFTMIDQRIVAATLLLAIATLCAAFVVAWAGWTGQMRVAFAAVSVILLLSLVSRTATPLFYRRTLNPATHSEDEMRYIGTRLAITRRAYAVDRVQADTVGTGFASSVEAAPRIAAWDGLTLASAAERSRRVRVLGDSPGWLASPNGITALLVERGNDGNTDARDVWGVSRNDAAGVDDRRLPPRVPSPTITGDELAIGEPAVYPLAPEYSVMSDSLHHLASVELSSTRSRLMHAWGLQNFRLIFGELPLNSAVIVRHRDVRERIEALAPFFVQGSEVVPVLVADTLYWAVELYSASASYPQSQRFTILGEERGYFLHAATALVRASSGRVRLVLDAVPDPVTMSWVARFPRLFVPLENVSPSVRAVLPPITDAARVQAMAFAAAGRRGDSLEVRHFAVQDGADSGAAREPVHAAIPQLGGVTAIWTLLDSTERVRGVVAATGGASRITHWVPVDLDGTRWGTVIDRLRMADSSSRETGVMRSALRVLPVGGKPLYLQSVFQVRAGAPPTLLRVSALANDSIRTGNTLAAALGIAPELHRPEPVVPRDLRLVADSLYKSMREALGRGDWLAFGRAFDALGVTIRATAR
ncbi:MAG: UPF0182 family protein [bacterium]